MIFPTAAFRPPLRDKINKCNCLISIVWHYPSSARVALAARYIAGATLFSATRVCQMWKWTIRNAPVGLVA